MVAAANQGQSDSPSSHFLDVGAGANITDMLISSPICMPEDMPGGGGDAAPGGNAMAGLGIDPNMDPELAEAIRISLEESKAADSSAQAQPAAEENKADANVQPGL